MHRTWFRETSLRLYVCSEGARSSGDLMREATYMVAHGRYGVMVALRMLRRDHPWLPGRCERAALRRVDAFGRLVRADLRDFSPPEGDASQPSVDSPVPGPLRSAECVSARASVSSAV